MNFPPLILIGFASSKSDAITDLGRRTLHNGEDRLPPKSRAQEATTSRMGSSLCPCSVRPVKCAYILLVTHLGPTFVLQTHFIATLETHARGLFKWNAPAWKCHLPHFSTAGVLLIQHSQCSQVRGCPSNRYKLSFNPGLGHLAGERFNTRRDCRGLIHEHKKLNCRTKHGGRKKKPKRFFFSCSFAVKCVQCFGAACRFYALSKFSGRLTSRTMMLESVCAALPNAFRLYKGHVLKGRDVVLETRWRHHLMLGSIPNGRLVTVSRMAAKAIKAISRIE